MRDLSTVQIAGIEAILDSLPPGITPPGDFLERVRQEFAQRKFAPAIRAAIESAAEAGTTQGIFEEMIRAPLRDFRYRLQESTRGEV